MCSSDLTVAHVARLQEQGRMLPAGLAAVAAARADGRWDAAYVGQASMTVPADLVAALAASPRAQAMWDVLTRANRYAITWRLASVKRAETRARNIPRFVAMLERGETPHPQRATHPDGPPAPPPSGVSG